MNALYQDYMIKFRGKKKGKHKKEEVSSIFAPTYMTYKYRMYVGHSFLTILCCKHPNTFGTLRPARGTEYLILSKHPSCFLLTEGKTSRIDSEEILFCRTCPMISTTFTLIDHLESKLHTSESFLPIPFEYKIRVTLHWQS